MSRSEASSDAEQISGIGWQTAADCEAFQIDFATDQGAPATTAPGVDAEFIREVGVLRVSLDVEMTTISDQLVESGLVQQIYVVRQGDRSLFIDFHLSRPAVARVMVMGTPARVSVELQPGGSEYRAAPAIADNVVLLSPQEGPVEVPVILSGYSRNFEANTVGRITQGDRVLAEGFTTAADWAETWGQFILSLTPSGSGEAELFAGEQSPQDGSDRGVVVAIRLP
ncbi:MAG TPA: Gmad2 immunoglobulin-like domain-containing protein [Acidimicrobiia bacterium]|nr:Gmad2 immunoglobulin-like domain-containing protein [Acidimicrobiia bacterium]